MNQSNLAESIARRAHAGQFRRDGVTPYITHPQFVASMFEDDHMKAVAWLHDVLEDTTETEDSLRSAGVGEDVLDTLEILTHKRGEDYRSYIRRVSFLSATTSIKIADIFHNMSSNPTDRQRVKYTEAMRILLQ